jgi:hypothetical protein
MIRNYFIFTSLLLSMASIWGMERPTPSQKSSVDLFSFHKKEDLPVNFSYILPRRLIQINWDIEDKYLPNVQLESNEGILEVLTFSPNSQGKQTLPNSQYNKTLSNEIIIDSQTFDLIKQNPDSIIRKGSQYWIPMLDKGMREYDITERDNKLLAALSQAIKDGKQKLYINPSHHVNYMEFSHNVWFLLFHEQFFAQLKAPVIPDKSNSITLTFVLNPKYYINFHFPDYDSVIENLDWTQTTIWHSKDVKNTTNGLKKSAQIIFVCLVDSKKGIPSYNQKPFVDRFASFIEYTSPKYTQYFNTEVIKLIKNFIQDKDSTKDFEVLEKKYDFSTKAKIAIVIAFLLGSSLLIFRKQFGNWWTNWLTRSKHP